MFHTTQTSQQTAVYLKRFGRLRKSRLPRVNQTIQSRVGSKGVRPLQFPFDRLPSQNSAETKVAMRVATTIHKCRGLCKSPPKANIFGILLVNATVYTILPHCTQKTLNGKQYQTKSYLVFHREAAVLLINKCIPSRLLISALVRAQIITSIQSGMSPAR